MDIQSIIIELLKNRGIYSKKEITEFLSEKPQKTYDPFLLLNMEAGVDLILSSIKEDKRICIYGDYDADGITATAVMLCVLSYLTDNIEYYIPSRFDEGYGLNNTAIDQIKANGAQLIVTVDCGSVSAKEVEYAKSLGMDIMVTDHHSITDKKPDCILINPHQNECSYPFKDLAGCGVAFKLAQAVQQRSDIPKMALTDVLDLVAIGTVGDIVPLLDENRTLVKYGLRTINLGKRPGLAALIKKISLAGQVSSENIAFGIVPHINAAGRMLDASISLEMLMAKQITQIEDTVAKLVSCNNERKKIQAEVYTKCAEIVENNLQKDKFILINAGDAHEGIAGIVAGKIKDTYNRPAIILTESGDFFKGTGRSIEGINIYNLLKKHEDFFEKFGGHAAACGFLMKSEKLEVLREALNMDVEALEKINKDIFKLKTITDMNIEINDITLELIKQIELFGPFGCRNLKPTFKIEEVKISQIKFMGALNQHARFIATDTKGKSLQCVMFGKANEYSKEMHTNGRTSIIGTIENQVWNGNEKLQLIIEKIGV